MIVSTITKSCTFYDVCLFFSSLSLVSIFVNVEKIWSALPCWVTNVNKNKLPPFDQHQITFLTGIYRCCSSIYNIFIKYIVFYCEIHLKYLQGTINRQFNSTMENNFAGKTACSLSYLGAGVR